MTLSLPRRPLTEDHLGHRAGTPEYRRILAATFAAGLATFVLLYATQALLPEFVRTFGVTPTQSTLAMSLTTGALAVSLLVAGPVSEIVGRTRLIHLSLTASAVVALLCALAPTWESLLALRLLAGVALAGLPAVATAYLREELHPSTLGRATGLYIGGTAVGGMAGRLVTAPVAEVAGWRWALAAAALLALLCAVVVLFVLPPSRGFTPAAPGTRSPLVTARRALSDPALLALYAIGACSIGSLVAVLNALGFRLSEAPFGLGIGVISLVYLVYLLGTVSSVVSGSLADRLGRRKVMPFGSALALVGVLLMLPDWLPSVVGGLAALTAGFFVVHGLASSWVAVRAHAAGVSTGQAAALYLFCYYVGSSVFGTLGGLAWSTAGWGGVALLSGGLVTVAGALALTLGRIPSLLTAPRPASP